MKEQIKDELDSLKEKLCDISDFIYRNPELGNEEFKASERLISLLKENNFEVEVGIAGKSTAFKAVYDSKQNGPTVAYLCEYDALPEIGHGCGHNLIGTIGFGAGVALSKVIGRIGGRVIVLGTPAEENDGAKVYMVEQGVFDDIDVAMIVHPAGENYLSGSSLAMDALQFAFKGRTSHAASAPEAGINALDAVLLTFNGINALRQHVTSDVRIHGIITEGGVAANIVPDRAGAQFYVRAANREYLNEVTAKVINIAKGAALMTGAELETSNYEISYDNMVTNKVLSGAFTKNLNEIGIFDIKDERSGSGSIDMGNVSRVVPSIHPYIGLGCPEVHGHTREMAQATVTDKAHEALINAAKALAMTGYDVITDRALFEDIKNEFVPI